MIIKIFLKMRILFVLLLSLSACNMPQNQTTPDISAFIAQTQTSLALEKILQESPTPPSIQPTPLATTTMSEEPTSQPTIPTTIPTKSPAEINCTNKAKFVNETVPDNSIFEPNDIFTKSWILQNVGTCTWTPDYELYFVEGTQMGGTSPFPIGGTVLPEGTIEINLPQTAPNSPGTYQGFWKIRSNNGLEFGIGEDSKTAFWVKIKVPEGSQGSSSTEMNLGEPDWVEDFSKGTSIFPIGSDTDTNFKIKNNQLEIIATSATGDHWRVANGIADNFTFEAQFSTNSQCSGKDSYGMIVRAPDQPDSIIDSGYIFTFSCDGYYRIYRMDNGNYSGIVNWTSHPSINKGVDTKNNFGIKAQDNLLQLYANGTMLIEFLDDTYSIGLFGITIRSDSSEDFKVNLQKLSYWNLNPK